VTRGSSLANHPKTPPKTTSLTKPLEPRYSDLHYIDLEVKDRDGTDFVTARGLLDSGSQGSCVNQDFSYSYLTDHKLKPTPTKVVLADGNDSSSGPITHFDLVTIRIAGHEEQLALDTMSLSHPIILGMPWHEAHNPNIDYQRHTLTFDSESCRQNCSHYGKTVPLYPRDRVEATAIETPAAVETHDEAPEQPTNTDTDIDTDSDTDSNTDSVRDADTDPDIDPATETSTRAHRHVVRPLRPPASSTPARLALIKRGSYSYEDKRAIRAAESRSELRSRNSSGDPAMGAKSLLIDTDTTSSGQRSSPRVALISAAAFALVCNQPGTELFFMSYKESEEGSVELLNQELEPDADLSAIPPQIS
jgi:hypothetical protein